MRSPTRAGRLRTLRAFPLLLCAALFASAPLAAQQELRSCEQAVSQLLAAGGRLESREAARGFGFEDRTINWRAADGSSGFCRVDNWGRVYAVEVETFGRGSGGAADWSPYQVTCESANGRRRECAIRDRSWVRLERQLSRGTCREGETWGSYGSRLWVDDGCRAVFLVSPAGGPGFPGGGGEGSARAARTACENKARMQGMQVLSAGTARRVDAQRWAVNLRVDLRGIRFDASCTFNERTGHVEISGR